MKRIYTCCDERYQWFLPTWAYSAKRVFSDTTIMVDFCGEMDPTCRDLLAALDVSIGIPFKPAIRPSCLRFLLHSGGDSETMITDVDIAFIDDGVWCYLMAKMRTDGLGCYAAFQGTKKHPVRPEIAPDGWKGDMRRLCGGFVMVTEQWYKQTLDERQRYAQLLRKGWGDYRESDEVMLCRICDKAIFVLPSGYKFNESQRNLHVGDFREDMRHRWTNVKKMQRLLPPESVMKTKALLADKGFQEVLSVVRACGGEEVNATWNNAIEHIGMRRP